MPGPLRLFVSSPGDVAEERLVARRVIRRVQASLGGTVLLDPIFWEHEPLLASSSFQGQLPRPSETDIVICILWSRLGTRLPGSFRRADGTGYASGTEFEFEDALAGFRRSGRPDLLVYRKTAAVALPDAADPDALTTIEQRLALDRFMSHWFHDEADGHLRAAFHSFETADQFEEVLEAHLRKLLVRHRPELATSGGRAAVTWQKGSPFRGLEAFGAEHSDIFFGRTRAVSECLAALRRQHTAGRPFLLIMGSSGCGKSSLVQAALLPMLVQPGVIEGVAGWQTNTLRPGEGAGNLVGLLARVLASYAAAADGPGEQVRWADVEGQLRNAPATIIPRVAALTRSTAVLPLVVLDQFEELFTDQRVTETERSVFLDLVRELCRSGGLWFIATMRSDLYAECGRYPALTELKDGAGQYDLLPPQAGELGQMIRLPAAAAGLRFDLDPATGQGLDELLRDEAVSSPEALPLLEFALDELYKLRTDNGTLTLHAYREIGGVAGALARRAEAEFQRLTDEAQATLPLVLQAAVAVSAEAGAIVARRSAPMAAIPATAQPLLEAFIGARLFISSLSPDGVRVFSVAHEALLRQWPRVTHWLEDNRELLRIRGRVSLAASRWLADGKPVDLLLSAGKQVDEALLLRRSGMKLSGDELSFIAASASRALRNQRVRWAAVAGLAVLAVLTGSAAFIANLQRQRAETETSTTRQTIEFMVGLFALADPEENRGNQVTVREILDRGSKRVAEELAGQPLVRSSLMTAMGRAYTGLGLYEPAKPLLEGAVEQYEAATGGGVAEGALRARLALASNRYFAGEYEPAEQGFREAVAAARRVYSSPHPDLSAALVGLGDCLIQRGETGEAEPLYREALELDRRMHGPLHLDVARSLVGLGNLHYFSGQNEQAEDAFRESLVIRRQKLGRRHAAVAESLSNLAAAQYQAGKYAEAGRNLEEALPIYREVFGAEHPEVATVLNNLGRSYLMSARIAKAAPLFTDALRIDRARKPPGHDDFVTPLNSLGMIAMARGDYAAAAAHFEEALAICRAHDHWLLSQVLVNLADLSHRQQRLGEAGKYIAEAREVLDKEFPRGENPAEEWRHAILDSIEASGLANRGERAAALPRLAEASAILKKRFGAGSLYALDADARLMAASAGNPG